VHARVDGLKYAENQVLVRGRALHELDSLRADQMVDVADPARAQIVEHDYLVSVSGEPFREMGPDETGSARDQILQFTSPFDNRP
jgi:hypothetical protein